MDYNSTTQRNSNDNAESVGKINSGEDYIQSLRGRHLKSTCLANWLKSLLITP